MVETDVLLSASNREGDVVVEGKKKRRRKEIGESTADSTPQTAGNHDRRKKEKRDKHDTKRSKGDVSTLPS